MGPLECTARGYLTGSGLADYRAGGAVGGHVLPSGLVEASRLDPAIFTPSTKAEAGEHDENITVGQAREWLGDQLAGQPLPGLADGDVLVVLPGLGRGGGRSEEHTSELQS